MADQKRWFKVWTSILVDMDNMTAADIGHWTKLGARTALVGYRGTVTFDDLDHAARFFQVPPDEVPALLSRLPSVSFTPPENRHGKLTVTMRNWVKYQEDSTQAQRAKTSRSKKRREENKPVVDGSTTDRRARVAHPVPAGQPELDPDCFRNQVSDTASTSTNSQPLRRPAPGEYHRLLEQIRAANPQLDHAAAEDQALSALARAMEPDP